MSHTDKIKAAARRTAEKYVPPILEMGRVAAQIATTLKPDCPRKRTDKDPE